MSELCVCTIASNNYLAHARVFARSVRHQHPEARVFVLVVDRPDPRVRYEAEPFETVFAADLEVPRLEHMAFRYSILELNTALKPALMLHLHRQFDLEALFYFDPDIWVLGDLAPLGERLRDADVLLTPHITSPLEDQAIPGERDFLLSGIYNLGFLGLAFNERTLRFLDWWNRRLRDYCLHDVARGLFTDQKWMDLAPAFLAKAEILADPGCNVAYWNLAERAIEHREGAWRANGEPLRFFHFSGFDVDQPETLSKFQNRFTLEQRAELRPLFRAYAERLRDEQHAATRTLPYGFGTFDNGWRVPKAARVALRLVDANGDRWPDPFRTSGEDSFLSWLRQPVSPGAIPRLALSIWDSRPDLRDHFPDPHGRDARAFKSWLASPSGEAEGIGPSWLPAEPAPREPDPRAAAESAPQPGLNDFDGGSPPLSRFALNLHRQRLDLSQSFPEPLGRSREEFAVWMATYGRREYAIPRRAILGTLRALPWRQRLRAEVWWLRYGMTPRAQNAAGSNGQPELAPQALPPLGPDTGAGSGPLGVNVVGWSSAPTGVGEACRGSIRALRAADLPCAVTDLPDPSVMGACDASPLVRAELPFETTLFHVNADMIGPVNAWLPAVSRAGRYRVGYWFWELSHFPIAFSRAFDHVDEVWAPTAFCADAFRALSPVPVRHVPPCVPAPTAGATARAELGVPAEDFLFYFAFDARSVPERKNPLGLLRAFAAVVRASPRPVALLIKVSHSESHPTLMAELRAAARGLPVTLLPGNLPRAAVDGITAACDAYVALHRSEGLGLLLIEAMYLGKPVIATDYGGTTDFLDPETGWPVRYSLVRLDAPLGPYPAGSVWADPDLAHATAAMLEVLGDPTAAAAKAAAARRRVSHLFSPEVAAERLRREFARIRERSPRETPSELAVTR